MDFLPAAPFSQGDARREYQREHPQGEPARTEAAPRSRPDVESRTDRSADSTRDATPFSRHLEARRKLDQEDREDRHNRENDPGPESPRKSGLDSKTDEPNPDYGDDASSQHERRLSENNSQTPDPDEARAHDLETHDLAHQTEPTATSWKGSLAAGSEAGEAGDPHGGPHVELEDGATSTPAIALTAQGPEEPAASLAPAEGTSKRGTFPGAPPPTVSPAVSLAGASEAVQTHEAPGLNPALELTIALENLGAQDVRVQWHWDRLQTASIARESGLHTGLHTGPLTFPQLEGLHSLSSNPQPWLVDQRSLSLSVHFSIESTASRPEILQTISEHFGAFWNLEGHGSNGGLVPAAWTGWPALSEAPFFPETPGLPSQLGPPIVPLVLEAAPVSSPASSPGAGQTQAHIAFLHVLLASSPPGGDGFGSAVAPGFSGFFEFSPESIPGTLPETLSVAITTSQTLGPPVGVLPGLSGLDGLGAGYALPYGFEFQTNGAPRWDSRLPPGPGGRPFQGTLQTATQTLGSLSRPSLHGAAFAATLAYQAHPAPAARLAGAPFAEGAQASSPEAVLAGDWETLLYRPIKSTTPGAPPGGESLTQNFSRGDRSGTGVPFPSFASFPFSALGLLGSLGSLGSPGLQARSGSEFFYGGGFGPGDNSGSWTGSLGTRGSPGGTAASGGGGGAGSPIVQVQARVHQTLGQGLRYVSLQLRPPELGRVQVQLELAGAGRLQLFVLVDRPDALEVLQRDTAQLLEALRQAGYDTHESSLHFQLNDQRRQRSGYAPTKNSGQAAQEESLDEAAGDASGIAASSETAFNGRRQREGRLDIRI